MSSSKSHLLGEHKLLEHALYGAIAMAAVAVALCLGLPARAQADVLAEYSWYTGETTSTYTLTTDASWAGFVNLVNGTVDVDGDGELDQDSFAGKTIVLDTDVNLRGNEMLPAGGGAAGASFDGTLDGQNHTIDNMVITDPNSTAEIGIIGHAGENSVIKNVRVGSSVIIGMALTSKQLQPIREVGLLVGYDEGSLLNCTSAGSITLSHAADQTKELIFPIENVGGLAGICLGNVANCTFTGAITITETGTPYAASDDEDWDEPGYQVVNVGGITGCMGMVDSSIAYTGSEEIDDTHGVLSYCTNSGVITVNVPKENGKDRFNNQVYAQAHALGGIAGYSRASVSSCTNTGSIICVHGHTVGGIVGSLRAQVNSTTTSTNFSSAGKDDGLVLEGNPEITLADCTNTGTVVALVCAGGMAGRAGTYSTITRCVNATDAVVVATRPNKPFPAGIVGSTYGVVSYCCNAGNIYSAEWDSDNNKVGSLKSGYYVSGIAGNIITYTDKENNRISPIPEVYGCYNCGYVNAVDNYRQRLIVGDNEGYIHDNVAETGKGYEDELIYDGEESTGTAVRNYVVTNAALKTNCAFDINALGKSILPNQVVEPTGDAEKDKENEAYISVAKSTVLQTINSQASADGWKVYWLLDPDGGYPVLSTRATTDPTDLSTAEVSLSANAEYTGLAAVPKATVTLDGVELIQDVDFYVKPQSDATEVTEEGEAPYSGTIVGIGSYTGTATQLLKYGIDKGSLANCTVLIDSTTFDYEVHEVTSSDIHVTNMGGQTVSPDNYTFVMDSADKNLTDGQAINAGAYTVNLEASDTSTMYYGENTGEYTIAKASIICSKDEQDKYAYPVTVEYNGVEYSWDSMTLRADEGEDYTPTMSVAYTGHSVLPKVTKVVYKGHELVEGVDYRVTYGSGIMVGEQTDPDETNIGTAGEVDYGYISVRYIDTSNFRNYENMKFVIDGTNTQKLDLADAVVSGADQTIVYEEGNVYTPITVSYGGSLLTEGVDYDITYTGNDAPGTATFTITACEDGLYTGTLTGSFTLAAEAAYTLSYSYDEQTHEATVEGVEYNGARDTFALIIPSTVTYEDTEYTVVAIADKAFGGTLASEFKDTLANTSKLKISSVVIPATVKTVGSCAFGYTGSTVSYYLNNLQSITFESGSQLQTIGDNAFRTCAIESIEIPEGVESIGNYAFRNCSSLKSVTFLTESADKPVLSNTSFYNLSNVAARGWLETGTAYTFATSTMAAKSWTWEVMKNPIDLSACTATVNTTALTYTGDEQAPDITVTSSEGKTLELGSDYSILYTWTPASGGEIQSVSAIQEVGTYSLTIVPAEGSAAYASLAVETPIVVSKAKIASASVLKASVTYTGSVQLPTVTVKDAAGRTLTKGTDYTQKIVRDSTGATVTGPVNAGSFTVTVTGCGNYAGTASTGFTITQAYLKSATLSATTAAYTGKALTPTVAVTGVGGKALTKGTDYTVSITNMTTGKAVTSCINVAKFKVTVTGKGNYQGTFTRYFTVTQQALTAARVTLSYSSLVYTGASRIPAVTVRNAAGTVLTKGTAYTVKVTNAVTGATVSAPKATGRYKVTVTGTGNYKGTVTKTYTIRPAVMAGLTLTSTSKGFTAKWTPKASLAACTGYQVKYTTGSTTRSVYVAGWSKSSRAITGLAAKTKYTVQVRAYKKLSDGTYVYGNWSAAKTVTTKA